MIDLVECCADIASIGIIVDFTETYIVGSPADILRLGRTAAVPEKLRQELCGTATNLAI